MSAQTNQQERAQQFATIDTIQELLCNQDPDCNSSGTPSLSNHGDGLSAYS